MIWNKQKNPTPQTISVYLRFSWGQQQVPCWKKQSSLRLFNYLLGGREGKPNVHTEKIRFMKDQALSRQPRKIKKPLEFGWTLRSVFRCGSWFPFCVACVPFTDRKMEPGAKPRPSDGEVVSERRSRAPWGLSWLLVQDRNPRPGLPALTRTAGSMI